MQTAMHGVSLLMGAAVSRILLVLIMLAATAGAVVAYGDPERIARAGDTVSDLLKTRAKPPVRAVQIARGQAGERLPSVSSTCAWQ